MLIGLVLSGLIINLSGQDIVITSDDFSVDSTGKIFARSGTIGGFDMTADSFGSDIYSEYDFNDEDLVKIQNYIMGNGTLTEDELKLYDVYKDSKVDIRDYVMIGNYIQTGISKSTPGKVIFSNGDVFNTITIKDGLGKDLINLNALDSYIKNLEVDTLSVGGMDIKSNRILWEGNHFMNANQTITLDETIQEQAHGVVLVWSAYDRENATVLDSNFTFVYVPKMWIELTNGGGYGITTHISGTNFSGMACKYVYVADDHITGHDSNTASGTTNGITYDNRNAVLRYVIGV